MVIINTSTRALHRCFICTFILFFQVITKCQEEFKVIYSCLSICSRQTQKYVCVGVCCRFWHQVVMGHVHYGMLKVGSCCRVFMVTQLMFFHWTLHPLKQETPSYQGSDLQNTIDAYTVLHTHPNPHSNNTCEITILTAESVIYSF